jgi:hypothetical protein
MMAKAAMLMAKAARPRFPSNQRQCAKKATQHDETSLSLV